jgi:glyoxylase-like metal-dependent hydrolase (beta-lactamase superfamily II)
MTKIQDDIYYFRNPINANCVVFAFKTGQRQEFDLIDTGTRLLGMEGILNRQMARDGLDPKNVRNIFHSHVHFDHIQADTLFQKRAVRNHGNVKVYVPEADYCRTQPDYSTWMTNMSDITKYFNRYSTNAFPNVNWQSRIVFDKILKCPTPANLIKYKNGDILEIGQYKPKVITTGGHTAGHSFFHFEENGILVVGDNDAVNETMVDFGCIIRSMEIAHELKPNMVFIGHNEPRLTAKSSIEWIERWFREYNRILATLQNTVLKNNIHVNITRIMQTMTGWLFNIEWVRFFTFMRLFVILKYLAKKGFGTIELTPDNVLYFHTSDHIEDMELKLEA